MKKLLRNIKIQNLILMTLVIMGSLSVAVGVIGLTSMLHYNKLAANMEQASARALIASKVNSSILSVVMDSRGIYMATGSDDVEKYGKPLLKNLDLIQQEMKDWYALMPEDRKAELDATNEKVQEFVKYRAEIVRLAREVSIADGRAWGDNEANRSNRKKLNDLVVERSESNAAEVKSSLENMQDYFVQQRALLIGLLAVVLPAVILLAFFISMSFIARPIRGMTSTMNELAGGNLSVTIPGVGSENEIGAMADAVEVFRQGLVEAQKLSEAEKSQQKAKEARIIAMDKLVAEFDVKITESLASINSASTELEATAQSLTDMAEQGSLTATSVAAASEEATTNVLTVSESSQKIAASTHEMISDMGVSRTAIDEAAKQAKETAEIAATLIDATRKIDDIVAIIQDIAGQTNLLALNATIEAARAGEMGKGFAVVANEVKSLATQTASSTEQIVEQVSAVQNVSTRIVTAINEISESMMKINSMSETMTETMSKQGSAISEISANIHDAAEGTRDVTQNINGVSRNAIETGNAASQLLIATSDIANQSTNLRDELTSFLRQIKQL